MRDLPEANPVSGFQYVTAEGETRRIAVAPEDFSAVGKLVDAGDFEALKLYPDG